MLSLQENKSKQRVTTEANCYLHVKISKLTKTERRFSFGKQLQDSTEMTSNVRVTVTASKLRLVHFRYKIITDLGQLCKKISFDGLG